MLIEPTNDINGLLAKLGLNELPGDVTDNLLLITQVGSVAHGCNVECGGDTDLLGVYVETPDQALGIQTQEHITASTGDNASANSHEDADLKLYSLRKFLQLVAAKGNPSAIELLFAPVIYASEAGKMLRASTAQLIHRNSGSHYAGYMQSQLQRLKGERGQMGVSRPELVEKYGYDTKYAYHVLRLGIQGAELMRTGRISMPLSTEHQELIRAVRQGAYTFEQFSTMADEQLVQLQEAVDRSSLPSRSDIQLAVGTLAARLHVMQWGQAGLLDELGLTSASSKVENNMAAQLSQDMPPATHLDKDSPLRAVKDIEMRD